MAAATAAAATAAAASAAAVAAAEEDAQASVELTQALQLVQSLPLSSLAFRIPAQRAVRNLLGVSFRDVRLPGDSAEVACQRLAALQLDSCPTHYESDISSMHLTRIPPLPTLRLELWPPFQRARVGVKLCAVPYRVGVFITVDDGVESELCKSGRPLYISEEAHQTRNPSWPIEGTSFERSARGLQRLRVVLVHVSSDVEDRIWEEEVEFSSLVHVVCDLAPYRGFCRFVETPALICSGRIRRPLIPRELSD
eukprot:6188807-Pleurochrysis_carterae.AAC.4